MNIALPKNPGILGYDVRVPKADVNHRFERHRVRRKSGLSFRPRLLNHMPESRGKSDDSCQRRSLKNIIREKRNGLETGTLRLLAGKKVIGKDAEIFRQNLGVNVKNGNQDIFIGDF